MNSAEIRGSTPRQRIPDAAPRRYGMPRSLPRLWRSLLAGAARPLRFALIGALCAGVQLSILFATVQLGVHPLSANVAAYLLSAQANFILSDRFIWHDRRSQRSRERVLRRWLSFHASIAGTFLLNEIVFIVARTVMPDLVAASAGIALSAFVNFVIQDRLTFRQ